MNIYILGEYANNEEHEQKKGVYNIMEKLIHVSEYATNNPANHTKAIQSAIDECAAGDTLVFPAGNYTSGKLSLRSNLKIRFEPGAVLRGSGDYLDYGDGAWTNGFITGYNLQNITIEGSGLLDGVDCLNPNGEEGFRGPHLFYFEDCENLSFGGYTVQNAANYAHMLVRCREIAFKNVTVLAGHDGIHMQGCANAAISNCVFKTGDDCIAGSDNAGLTVENCEINTSCNGFRIGSLGLRVSGCKFYGPGEYKHRVSGRTNMLAAFIYFSPKERGIELFGDDWLVSDCTVENVGYLFYYDFSGIDPWQNGKPLFNATFENIAATGVACPIYCRSDGENALKLTLKNLNFSFLQN
jgi:hypothetical protein